MNGEVIVDKLCDLLDARVLAAASPRPENVEGLRVARLALAEAIDNACALKEWERPEPPTKGEAP
jgi:hypothetical protein